MRGHRGRSEQDRDMSIDGRLDADEPGAVGRKAEDAARYLNIGNERPGVEGPSRRDFLGSSAVVGAALVAGSGPAAGGQPDSPRPLAAPERGGGGLLFPQQNQHRNMLDLSGLWQFQ